MVVEVLASPIKSSADKNEYRIIRLENGLKVCLIRHPKSEGGGSEKMAALNLFVDVGGYDDGAFKGISHFTEHLLFMGSERYPKENEYHQFITNNGGDLNAMTGFGETIYFFSIVEEAFEGAMDRFSSIFIKPLMHESSIEREIESVESEFQNRKNNDFIRLQQIVFDSVKDDHPAKCFIPGNLTTLKENITNTQLHQAVHAHYNKYYVAKRMTLAVESNRELDELQDLVDKYFKDLKSGEPRETISYDNYLDIFKPEFYSKLVYVKPKTDKKTLVLSFPIPASYKYYKSQPTKYLVKVLESEHEGGLSSYLKKKLLVTNYYASDSIQFGDMPIFSMMTLNFKLTDYGSNHIAEILEAVYSWLLLMKETPIEKHQEIYENIQSIALNQFKYKQADEPDNNVMSTATNLNQYQNEDLLRADDLFIEYDAEALKKYIDLTNEKKFNISIMDHEVNENFDKLEPYFGIEYATVDYPESFSKAWDERKINPDFKLPPKNEFVCTNFEIYADKENVVATEYPEKIIDSNIAEVWYKLDGTFKLPYADVSIYFISPFIVASNFNVVLAKLYTEILNLHLKEKLASATEAGLNFSVSLYSSKFVVSFNGYNEKIELLVDIVTREMKNFNDFLEENIFDVYKAKTRKDFLNSLITGSYFHSFHPSILSNRRINNYEFFLESDKVTFGDMQMFVDKFMKRLHLKMLIEGNLSKEQALAIGSTVLHNIAPTPLTEPVDWMVRQLPEGKNFLKVKPFLFDDKNSMIFNLYDLGERSMRLEATLDLLVTIMDEPLFDILRTKEQLGYSVGMSMFKSKDALYLMIYIKSQEDKHSAKSVYQRLLTFLADDMKVILEALTDENFEKVRESQIKIKTTPFTDLGSEFSHHWKQIVNEDYLFNRRSMDAKTLKTITKNDLLDVYNTRIKNARCISLQLIGNIASTATDNRTEAEKLQMQFITEKYEDDDVLITDIDAFDAFRRNLKVYPRYHPQYD